MASVFILGAGAMGSLWASHLHHAYTNIVAEHSVQFISSRAYAPTKETFSLKSSFISKTHTVFDTQLPVFTPNQLPQASSTKPNIFLICTKSYHAFDACLALSPHLNEHNYVILFQNGLGSQHKILDALHGIPIYAAVSTEGVNRQKDGLLVHAGKGLTRIGPLNAEAKQPLSFNQCVDALSHEGLDVKPTDTIWQSLWEKLAINCAINPFTAILNCPNGEIKQSSLFQETWPNLKSELCQMLNTAGFVTSEPELEQKVFQVIHNTQHNISSMLQDIRAKRKTEIEDINGFAAAYLAAKGLNNFSNKKLYDEIRASK